MKESEHEKRLREDLSLYPFDVNVPNMIVRREDVVYVLEELARLHRIICEYLAEEIDDVEQVTGG